MTSFEKDTVEVIQRLTLAVHSLYCQHKMSTGEVCSDYEQAMEAIMDMLTKMEKKAKSSMNGGRK